MVKTAKELLKKFQTNVDEKPKKSFSLSLEDEQMTKLEYLSDVSKMSKNEITRKALIAFGLDDIKIPDNYQPKKPNNSKKKIINNNNFSDTTQQNFN